MRERHGHWNIVLCPRSSLPPPFNDTLNRCSHRITSQLSSLWPNQCRIRIRIGRGLISAPQIGLIGCWELTSVRVLISSPVRVCALCVLHGPDWGGSGVFSPLSICHNERLLMIWVTFSCFKCVCVCVCCILLTQLNTKGRLLMFWRVFLLVVLSLVFLLVFCSF